MRDAAIDVLERLRPDPRAEHAASALSLVSHGNEGVRNTAIHRAVGIFSGREGRAALSRCATELMGTLMDSSADGDTQEATLQALANIDRVVLMQAHIFGEAHLCPVHASPMCTLARVPVRVH